jgi:hypothetical protein
LSKALETIMSALIHALFDRPDIAVKARDGLEAAGIAGSRITIVEGGDRVAQEASQLLDQHGMSSETATIYVHALSQGGSFLWFNVDPKEHNVPDITEMLRADGAVLVDTATVNDDADELNEAEGWDDFNQHGNEHSPDLGSESMWTDRNGNIR